MAYRLQPAGVQAKWAEYRKECDENIATVRYRDKLVQVPKKIIYSLEGFCLFLDLSEDDLKKYENNKNYRAVFKKIRYQVMCRKMEALVNGEGNTRGLIFDLKVNHGIDPKQAREETDWKVTLNLNHDRSPEVGKLESPEVGKAEIESGSPGNRKTESKEEGKSGSPEVGKAGGMGKGEPETKTEGPGTGQEAIQHPATELPPEKKTIPAPQPPVIPGVRPGLVPTGGVLPYGTPPKLNYEPEYKPERNRYR